MSQQMTLPGMINAIFSRGSAFGVMPCASQDGRTIGRSGLDRAHANLTVRQAKERVYLMSATSGRSFSGSSASAVLQQLLGSRLRVETALLGSILYKITWKARVTPAGRSIPALRASVRRTFGSACTGWPTPLSNSANGAGVSGRQVALAGWTTPMANDSTGSTHCYGPKRPDGTRPEFLKLPGQVRLSGPDRLTASVEMLTGSTAGMVNGGQLNPAHARWLQGLPAIWDACAVMAMRSMHNRQQHS